MSFRKEKKYRLSNSDLKFLKSLLIDKGMKILHPKRIINSCYFDTKNLRMFHDSEEGVIPRKKVRFRWYDNTKIINKEIKITSTEGRYKISSRENEDIINNFLFHKAFDKDYGNLYSIILIKYIREYYIYNNLRITFDTGIEYKDIKSINKNKYFEKEVVMEVKTSIFQSDDFFERVIDIQPSRFSKYCRGIINFLQFLLIFKKVYIYKIQFYLLIIDLITFKFHSELYIDSNFYFVIYDFWAKINLI